VTSTLTLKAARHLVLSNEATGWHQCSACVIVVAVLAQLKLKLPLCDVTLELTSSLGRAGQQEVESSREGACQGL